MCAIIYKTTNLINDKIYVGYHGTSAEDNYLGSGLYLKRAIDKYNKKNFKREVLEYVCDDSWSEREIYWISELSATNFNIGYNIALGGNGGFLGHDVNEKRRKSLIGRVFSEEHKKKLKYKKSDDTKQKIRQAHLGKKLTKEHKNKISLGITGKNNPMFGKHHSEITKIKLRKKFKGIKKSKEFCENIRRKNSKFIYYFLSSDGNKISVEGFNIKCFCKDNGFNYNKILDAIKKETFYNGMKVTRELLNG